MIRRITESELNYVLQTYEPNLECDLQRIDLNLSLVCVRNDEIVSYLIVTDRTIREALYPHGLYDEFGDSYYIDDCCEVVALRFLYPNQETEDTIFNLLYEIENIESNIMLWLFSDSGIIRQDDFVLLNLNEYFENSGMGYLEF